MAADDDDIDPKVMAARAAQVAKNIIAAAGDVADQVFAKAGPAKVDPDGGAPQEDNADKPRYTAADAIQSVQSGGRAVASLSGKTRTGAVINANGSLSYIAAPTGVGAVLH